MDKSRTDYGVELESELETLIWCAKVLARPQAPHRQEGDVEKAKKFVTERLQNGKIVVGSNEAIAALLRD